MPKISREDHLTSFFLVISVMPDSLRPKHWPKNSYDPHHTTQIRFESPDGSVMSRTWTSTPGKWHVFTDRDEICFILSGSTSHNMAKSIY